MGLTFAMAAADLGTWALGDAGFAGSRTGDGRYFVFDVGPIGPDHQPGHGHAGVLSFELSAGRRRIVTDTGVLTYAAGGARLHDRSTAAHTRSRSTGAISRMSGARSDAGNAPRSWRPGPSRIAR